MFICTFVRAREITEYIISKMKEEDTDLRRRAVRSDFLFEAKFVIIKIYF